MKGCKKVWTNYRTCCENWQLSLYSKKTKTMVVQQNICKTEPFIFFNSKTLQNVNEYKFLGTLIKSNGSLNYSLEKLAEKAKRCCLY